MKQDALARWLKFIIIGVGLCGLITYTVIMPRFGAYLVRHDTMLERNVMPWLILIWISAIPCYIVLFLGWRVADNIGADRSFSHDNAKYLKWISWLAAGDAAYFFLGNIVLWFSGMNHPGIVLYSLIVVFAGIAISVAAAALSHLVLKAAVLQEESDLTV